MRILITGAAGFIGFNLSKFLLINRKVKIYGVDNLNEYYSKKLKLNRIKKLKKFKNFNFKKIDICKKDLLINFIKHKNIQIIINLAAQAGVRYSLEKPSEFVNNNILGFYNIINTANELGIKKIIYASSSSIYGDSNKFPLKENQNVNPKNIYALSKKTNEEMARVFSKQHKISFIGLRFFTVYGEWGRPDMLLMKYLEASYNKKKKFFLNNFGNHTRDFTYILDACELVKKIIFSKKIKSNHEIFNICSNNPIRLKKIIGEIDDLTNRKPKIYKRSLQQADVVKTHGSNKKIQLFIGHQKFTPIKSGLFKTLDWYKKYYNY